MPGNRDNSRGDDARNEHARNDYSRNDNDSFGGSSRSDSGTWSNRDNDTTRNAGSGGRGYSRDLNDEMEAGGSRTSSYGDEHSSSRDRFRASENSRGRDLNRDRSMNTRSNADMGADSWGGGADRDTGRDRYSTRENGSNDESRDDYYGNRSINKDRGQDRNQNSASDRGYTDRYSGREGGTNQFSSMQNGPSDMRQQSGRQAGQQWGANSRSDMQRGQHAGRGPKGYRRDDARITEDVNEVLTHDPHIDASEIEVRVSGGEVTLSGTVDTRDAKRHAEDLAESVSGVSDVTNQIRVSKAGSNASSKPPENDRMNSARSTSSSHDRDIEREYDEEVSKPENKRSAKNSSPDAAMSHSAGTGPSGAANTSVMSNNPSGKPSPNTSGASTQRTGDRGSHG